MNCQEFRSQLEQTLEKSCQQDVELQRHGESCRQPMCRDAWEEFLLLEVAIEDWRHGTRQRRQMEPGLLSPQLAESPSRSQPAAEWRQRRFVSRNVARWGSGLTAMACLLLLGWLTANRPGISSGDGREISREEVSEGSAAESMPAQFAVIPVGSFSSPGGLMSVGESAPAGLLVNLVAGTPLQVSGSMAMLFLGRSTHEAESSGWMPIWMEGWSEQVVPSMDDMELLRTLLLDPQSRHSHFHSGHSERERV